MTTAAEPGDLQRAALSVRLGVAALGLAQPERAQPERAHWPPVLPPLPARRAPE